MCEWKVAFLKSSHIHVIISLIVNISKWYFLKFRKLQKLRVLAKTVTHMRYGSEIDFNISENFMPSRLV